MIISLFLLPFFHKSQVNTSVYSTQSQYFCLSNYKNVTVLCSFSGIFRSLIFNSKNLKRPLFQAFSTLLLVYLSQHHHALHMPRMRKHIKRLNIGHCVLFCQRFQIPCLRSRIAGNINYSFRCDFYERV